MDIFTIGFTQKNAEEFFTLLTQNGVKKLIDIRLNNKSQLAGFANARHLPYFLKLHGIQYEHRLEFAPTKALLSDYQNKRIDWSAYQKIYNQLLLQRDVLKHIALKDFDRSVFLCSESSFEQCHRRLVAEHIASHFDDIMIKHL